MGTQKLLGKSSLEFLGIVSGDHPKNGFMTRGLPSFSAGIGPSLNRTLTETQLDVRVRRGPERCQKVAAETNLQVSAG